jgi:hypothetical protein
METFLMEAVSTQSGMTLPRPMRTPLRSVYLGPVFQSSLRGTRFQLPSSSVKVLRMVVGSPCARGALAVTFTVRGCWAVATPALPNRPAAPASIVTRTVFDECNILSSWGCVCD